MKLEKIKLAGFKSFVDPTTIPITGNLTAIVGPNGCGKSNIIDAVRWVMGESSAKHLRGGSMADVIFNGSSGRKPVSTATVELIFNNTESKLGGEYAQYDTIAIKRQVSRDGQSIFFLNGSRCRRKDISDLFLGTGLGSRSYAIIEQGTISRMVEAKPDELRIHIEEAAGISKYKERRMETETRMKHTRENLERLDDLREEVGKQIKNLQKQAEKAEKYTSLKKQERQFKLELLAMRWQHYHQTSQQLEKKLHATATEHNRLFIEVRDLESEISTKRAEYKAIQQQTNNHQGDFYTIVAEVSRLEQAIKHHQQNQQQTLQDINRNQLLVNDIKEKIQLDLETLATIQQQYIENEQQCTVGESRYSDCLMRHQQIQTLQSSWQQQWDSYRTESARYKEQLEIQRVKSVQIEGQNRQLQIRIDKLNSERDGLRGNDLSEQIAYLEDAIEQIAEQGEQLNNSLTQLNQSIAEQKQQLQQINQQQTTYQTELAGVFGKIDALELLQQHALGKDNQPLTDWLTGINLQNTPRLAEFLEVQIGWETAIETVLSAYLEAICINEINPILNELAYLQNQSVTLLATDNLYTSDTNTGSIADQLPCLLDKVSAPWPMATLLTGIFCANDINIASALSSQLAVHQSIITPDGSWFGCGWLKISRAQDSKTGLLQREKQLRLLKQRLEELENITTDLQDQRETIEKQLKDAESHREQQQRQATQLGLERSARHAELSAQSARQEQQQHRLKQINDEASHLSEELVENSEMIADYHLTIIEAEQRVNEQEQQRLTLESANQQLANDFRDADNALNIARQQIYELKSKREQLRSSELATQKQIERMLQQQQQMAEQIIELEKKQQQTLAPLVAETQQLAEKSETKAELEDILRKMRRLQDESEQALGELSEQLLRTQRELEKQKEYLDQFRFELQENQVRQQSIEEQFKESNANVQQILPLLPNHAEEKQWKRKVDELSEQIDNLGTINLLAIEEFQSQTERMKFLDEQQTDLLEALQTLDQAINKIDQQSRLRFRETFDKINSGLQEKFPKLFGGGQAYLELTDQDLLESGVNIIARPPGKRNSSIHLLSGGEKALTAVALVFSIFELNPAPFCLLDEVDAPLDDANVGRFSKMVEEMSTSVQFLYISHNKVTMEIAQQLAGVTMKEPGVSRMVAVDIEEAVSLAEI